MLFRALVSGMVSGGLLVCPAMVAGSVSLFLAFILPFQTANGFVEDAPVIPEKNFDDSPDLRIPIEATRDELHYLNVMRYSSWGPLQMCFIVPF